MTASTLIDYDALTQEALRGVVRKILNQVVTRGGLPGEHHFYIAFNTQAPGVSLSRRLKEKYPEEMMIVLQHRFWDLAVTEEGFEVKLTFDGIPERLYVPFEALRVFFDPSVRFTLQFGEAATSEDGQDGQRRRRDGDAAGRPGGDRRPRPRPAAAVRSTQRTEDPAEAAPGASASTATPQSAVPAAPGSEPETQPAAPATLVPRPVTVPNQPAAAEKPAKEAGGAKVFSLDQFRNKK